MKFYHNIRLPNALFLYIRVLLHNDVIVNHIVINHINSNVYLSVIYSFCIIGKKNNFDSFQFN